MEPMAKKSKIKSSHKEKSKSNLAQPLSAQNVLTNDDVLKIIFSNLSAYDLCQASKICRAWKHAADNEILYRREPECISKNFKLAGYTCTESSDDPNLLGKELRIRPELGLVFEKCLEKNDWKVSGSYGHLPRKCKKFIVGGYEIVSNNSTDFLANAVGVFLPKFVPQVHQVFIKEKDPVKYQNTHGLLDLPNEPNEHTCIIVLTDFKGYSYTKSLMNALKKRYKPGSLSLWGGVCLDLKLCNGKKSQDDTDTSMKFLMVKLSDPNLKSWSIIIPPKCRSEDEIENKLENLKKSIELKKYSFGLMFACCERSAIIDLEVKVFKKVFPEVPLAGLSGDGEIGLNTLNDRRESNLQHTLTTVFLILTYDLSLDEARMQRNYGNPTGKKRAV